MKASSADAAPVTGGGAADASERPHAGPTPAAPAAVAPAKDAPVTGGGAAATTCFSPPEPSQCGDWTAVPPSTTPAPAPAPSTGDGPPEPIALPPSSRSEPLPSTPAPSTIPGDPDAAATGPARSLPTWPQWQAHFLALGLSAPDVARIGDRTATDAQLARVYEQLHRTIVQQGGTPPTGPVPPSGKGEPAPPGGFPVPGGVPTPPPGTPMPPTHAPTPGVPGWDAQWEQAFAALGLPADILAQIKSKAIESGADDIQLKAVYDTIVQQVPVPTKPGEVPVPGPVPPGQVPGQEQPGWNEQWTAAFAQLGAPEAPMPASIIEIYATSGAPTAGIEAAYRHASARLADFRERGWFDRFVAEKVDPEELWGLILADKPLTDKQLEGILQSAKNKNMPLFQKAIQTGLNFLPGGFLAQFALGKKVVSGEEIDRTNPMNIGMAALSGVALFMSIRGVRNITKAWAPAQNGYQELTKVGLTTQGQSVTDAALGGMQHFGFKQKLMSLIPFTDMHSRVVGMGHAEAAAKAINGGGAAKLLATPDGALQMATISQLFDDIKTGAMSIRGGSNAYLGGFMPGAPMGLSGDVIKVAKNLSIGDGRSQVAALLHVGGDQLARNPGWLRTAPAMVDDIAKLPNAHLPNLGRIMAGDAVATLGVGRDGIGSMRFLNSLKVAKTPEWYAKLAATTDAEWRAAGLVDAVQSGTDVGAAVARIRSVAPLAPAGAAS